MDAIVALVAWVDAETGAPTKQRRTTPKKKGVRLRPRPVPSSTTPRRLPPGIANGGAACYCNAVVQALLGLRAIENLEGGSFQEGTILEALQDIVVQSHGWRETVSTGSGGTTRSSSRARLLINTRKLWKTFRGRFSSRRQEDAGELFTHLMAKIAKDHGVGFDALRIIDSFKYQQGSINSVDDKGTKSARSTTVDPVDRITMSLIGLESPVDLAALLDTNFSFVRLTTPIRDGKREWKFRRVDMVTSPSVLLVRLVNYDWDTRRTVKPAVVVSVDLTLPAVKRKVKYMLHSIVLHSGSTIRGGHYIAIRRVRDGWAQFNDRQVTPIAPTRQGVFRFDRSFTPVMLFYTKRDDSD